MARSKPPKKAAKPKKAKKGQKRAARGMPADLSIVVPGPPELDGQEKSNAGRPSKFRPEYVERVRRLCESGAVDREIAQAFGVAESTLYEWKHRYPDFSEAMKPGKELADDRVERALFNRAVGYSFDSEKIMQFEGDPVRVPCVEHVPPDVTAARIWLENRRRDKWGPKVQTAPPVGPGLTVVIQQAIGVQQGATITPGRVEVRLPKPA